MSPRTFARVILVDDWCTWAGVKRGWRHHNSSDVLVLLRLEQMLPRARLARGELAENFAYLESQGKWKCEVCGGKVRDRESFSNHWKSVACITKQRGAVQVRLGSGRAHMDRNVRPHQDSICLKTFPVHHHEALHVARSDRPMHRWLIVAPTCCTLVWDLLLVLY
jgi:hypothetical protein